MRLYLEVVSALGWMVALIGLAFAAVTILDTRGVAVPRIIRDLLLPRERRHGVANRRTG
jgi:hypothetical protein